MNHLAHFLLAPGADLVRAGTLMADFSRGPDLAMHVPEVALGIRLHRRVDALVDGAPEVEALKPLLAGPLRRYAGIVLDVMFDHVLIRQWDDIATIERGRFGASVYASLARSEPHMPEPARRLAQRMRQYDLLSSCASLAGCERTLASIARRLARPVALERAVAAYAPHLDRIEAALPPLLQRLRAGVGQLQAA